MRAAVLGANDGIGSTASLVVGVTAADASHSAVLTAGVAGLVAGAMSMAAGEYVSVSSQSDTERADLDRERRELEQDRDHELGIYETTTARPLQAAVASVATFAVGAAMPLLSAVVSPVSSTVPVVAGSSLIFLALLGALAARVGGAPILRSAFRVTFWGVVAMGLTAAVGAVFGTAA